MLYFPAGRSVSWISRLQNLQNLAGNHGVGPQYVTNKQLYIYIYIGNVYIYNYVYIYKCTRLQVTGW